MKVVSVHVPKCGGLSTRRALLKHYQKTSKLRLDYSDQLGNSKSEANVDPKGFHAKALLNPENRLEGVDVVHGHFRVSKYDNVKNALRVTILRHPVDRLISLFFYQRSRPIDLIEKPYTISTAWDIRTGRLSIEQLSTLPLMRRFYADIYFGNFDMERFDYIGKMGSGETQTQFIAKALNVHLNDMHVNQNLTEGYSQIVADLKADKPLMSRLTNNLRDDIDFYERWAC